MLLERDHKPVAIDRITRRIAMRPEGERRYLVEDLARLGDDPGPADRVVAGTAPTAIFL